MRTRVLTAFTLAALSLTSILPRAMAETPSPEPTPPVSSQTSAPVTTEPAAVDPSISAAESTPTPSQTASSTPAPNPTVTARQTVRVSKDAASTPIATIGTTGHAAYQVQGMLRRLAILNPSHYNGTYDANTVSAVKRFQARVGLAQTGIVDQVTFNKLVAAYRAESVAHATVGTTGHRAYQVQGMLRRLGHIGPRGYTGRYDTGTAAGVKRFQARVGLEQSGVVYPITFQRLQAEWRKGSVPYATVGTTGHRSRQVEGMLVKLGYMTTADSSFDKNTAAAVKRFQARRGIEQSGVVYPFTFTMLQTAWRTNTFRAPAASDVQRYGLDKRCDDEARVLCADQSRRKVWYLENGKVVKTFDARFGAPSTPTRNGSFRIFYKKVNEVSYLYNMVPMPYSMYFSGGQAFHYSADFARVGWANGRGGSHGCINIRDYSGLAWVYNRVPLGTLAVVYP